MVRAAGVTPDNDIRSLVANGLRKDMEKQVTADAEERTAWLQSEKTEFDGMTRDQWEKQELDRRVAERMVELGLSAGEAAPRPAADATSQANAAPLAPADPTQRTVGQVYRNAAGKRAEWTGEGWRPVD